MAENSQSPFGTGEAGRGDYAGGGILAEITLVNDRRWGELLGTWAFPLSSPNIP